MCRRWSHKNDPNHVHLWKFFNTLLFDIVEENKNGAKACLDEDVHDMFEIDNHCLFH